MFGQLTKNCLRSLGRSLPIRAQLQKNPITYLVMDLSSFCVCLKFHASLGFKQLLANAMKHFIPVGQGLVNSVNARIARKILQETERLMTKRDLVWCSARVEVP